MIIPVLLLLATIGASAVTFPSQRRLVEMDGVTDHVEIKFQSASEADIEHNCGRILQETGCSEATRLYRHAGIHESKHVAAGLNLWYTFDCDAAAPSGHAMGEGAQTAITRLQHAIFSPSSHNADEFGMDTVDFEHEIVENVQFDSSPEGRVVRRSERDIRGDSHRSLLSSNDPLSYKQDHYDVINMQTAWDIMTENDAWRNAHKTVCHVLDSGMDLNHQDLKENVWNNPGETCGTGTDDDGNGFTDDCHGYNHADNKGTDLLGKGDHGTHCSGTISARTDNNIGVAGVAGGRGSFKGVSLMTSVGFGNRNRGFGEALIYAADNGADVSSNSWGYSRPKTFPKSLQEAIDYAVNAGVVVVFAAGNTGSDAEWYPAYYDKVIAVAAVEDDKEATSFSNYGTWVDIAAPGRTVYSTSIGNSYVYKSGTSMACPHVSGVLSLGKALYPQATAAELKGCLLSTAEDIDEHQDASRVGKLGAGLVDAPAFLGCVKDLMPTTPNPTDPLTPSPTPAPIVSPLCGNGVLDAGEACDSSTTCADVGFPEGGNLVCSHDCQTADASGCYKVVHMETGLSAASKRSIFGSMEVTWDTNYIRVETFGGAGDADLYVLLDDVPNIARYDCRPYAHGNLERCTTRGGGNPRGEYNWMIRGYKAFSGLNLRVVTDGNPPLSLPVNPSRPVTESPTASPTATPTSSPTGAVCGDGIISGAEACDSATTCQDMGFGDGGTLVCSQDCMAVDTSRCRHVVLEKQNLSAGAGSVIRGSVDITEPAQFISLGIEGGSGDADLYVRIGEQPGFTSYNCRPWANGNEETCVAERQDDGTYPPTTYHYMLYGYRAFSGVTLKVIADGDQTAAAASEASTPPNCEDVTSCNVLSPDPGCSACLACETIVCAVDSFCCDNWWDVNCANAAADLCAFR